MMIKKKRKYSADFKAKVVLELLGGDQTLAPICSKHSLVSKYKPFDISSEIHHYNRKSLNFQEYL